MSHPKVVHPRDTVKKKTSRIGRLNQWLAIKLGNLLGSMTFFYVCIILDIIELPAVIQAGSAIAWVTYIAQTVIQLVALPIISTQQNIQQAQSEAKADVDHNTLTYLAEIQDEQLAILKELKEKK